MKLSADDAKLYMTITNYHAEEILQQKLDNSSLQCFIVLSTIAQVLRKMSLKILAS